MAYREHRKLSFFNSASLICTWFGAGLSPKASGTAGSLAALPFAYFIQTNYGDVGLLVAAVLAFAVGWIASNVYLLYTDAKDPKEIVIDEVAGQWLILSFLYPTFISYCVGFALFRLFDAMKPWPVSLADRHISGGFGVMFDDILAALYPLLFFYLVSGLLAFFGHSINQRALSAFLSRHYVF